MVSATSCCLLSPGVKGNQQGSKVDYFYFKKLKQYGNELVFSGACHHLHIVREKDSQRALVKHCPRVTVHIQAVPFQEQYQRLHTAGENRLH